MSEQAKSENKVETVPIIRPEGLNDSERYLAKLCDKSFLSLWSYPSLTKDQGRNTNKDGIKVGDGKELCDLLVVFGNDIIIFQDKKCEFKQTDDLQLDWDRWYRSAVTDGAKQIWGAERWIKEHPNLIFVDRFCTQPFPFAFPNPEHARYHRVIVAHGASERCKRELGGSGSLMVFASRVAPVAEADICPMGGKQPFTIGQPDPSKGFIHVFDDTTLDIVLETLDTASDFVSYLLKKERFVSSDHFLYAAGEEELLAAYLKKLNTEQVHDFVFPTKSFVMLGEGSWSDFCNHHQRKAQLEANRISYAWDALIESFNKHNLAGTQHFVSHTLKETEVIVRFLAGENRTARRALAKNLYHIVSNTPSNQRGVRVMQSLCQRNVYYVLMVFPHLEGISEEDYRIARRTHLMHYCMVIKLLRADANHIVGIATDAGIDEYRSEDLAYYDATDWSEAERTEAEQIRKEFNLLNTVRAFEENVQEYPSLKLPQQKILDARPSILTPHHNHLRVGRNELCPCGSGNKFKRCHGK